jgi:hypothetical protein
MFFKENCEGLFQEIYPMKEIWKIQHFIHCFSNFCLLLRHRVIEAASYCYKKVVNRVSKKGQEVILFHLFDFKVFPAD